MNRKLHSLLGSAALSLTLCACGGGGGGVASTPPPTVTPSPTPTPTPTPGTQPLPPAHIALVSSQPFAALGVTDAYSLNPSGGRTRVTGPSAADVQFSYDPSSNSYRVSLPAFQSGSLANTQYGGSAGQVATESASQVTVGSSDALQPVLVTLPVPGSSFSPYTYTSFGWWDGTTGQAADGQSLRSEGMFAYGIPTQPGDVPITGSASYGAEIHATLGDVDYPTVSGEANLSFDFGAGTLSGSMHPRIADSFDGIFVDYGQYAFTQTVYSTGSTTFSGKFVVPGLPNADSFFNGNFTGPNAAELMARFVAPFLHDGQQGTISGIWIGKKN